MRAAVEQLIVGLDAKNAIKLIYERDLFLLRRSIQCNS